MMRRVIIESPFAGDLERNKRYLEWAIHDSLKRGEAPFASHAIYPGALNDDIPEDRELGIKAGYEWWNVAEAIVFYRDFGMSHGMQLARELAKDEGMLIEDRYLWPINDMSP
jgi:hypothetical protein